MSFVNYLNKILNIGASEIEPDSQMYLRQVNINGLFFFFVTLGLSAFFHFIMNDDTLCRIMLYTALAFITCSVGFNYAGLTTLSRMSTVSVGSLAITACALYIREDAFFTAYFILGAVYPFTYFSIEDKLEIFGCLAILIACYVLVTFFNYSYFPRIKYISAEHLDYLKIFAFAIGFSGVVYNSFIAIYERDRKNKEVLKAQKLLETVFFTLAHDLADPLQNISIISQLGESRGSLTTDRLKKLSMSSQQMIRSFNNLKIATQTSLNPGYYKLNTAGVTVSELLLDAAEYLREQADLKGIKIQVNLPEVIGKARVNVDRDIFVYQVLNNLILNSIQFSSAGQTIKISADFSDSGRKGDELIQICIQDWGKGINKKDLSKIFDMTLRTGLGIPLASKFIKFMDGQLEIKSRSREDDAITGETGTTAIISLPLIASIQNIRVS